MIYALLESLTFWCISLQSFSRPICCVPLKFICWNLIPTVMVIGVWAFKKWLSPEDGALMNGISATIKDTPATSLAFSTVWGHRKEIAVYESGSGPFPKTKSASALILDFLPPEQGKINFCYLSHPIYGIFVIAAQMN